MTMTAVRFLGRRKLGQCARGLGYAFLVTVGLAPAALASGPVRTDEPGAIVAAFSQRSYAPGQGARLQLNASVGQLTGQFFRAGPERKRSARDDVLGGVPAGPARRLTEAKTQWLTAPRGPSGLYFLQLTAPGGRLGYAPFVLRPRHPGTARVLVVLPTNTWQAYNFRGCGTWYPPCNPHNGVDLTRPFLNRGVPPHFRGYDRGFIRWLAHTGKHPDFLADDDLERLSGGELTREYDLVVFSGHDEYETRHVWTAIEQYRDHGGNLAFLSANDFFYRVARNGHRLTRTGHWYDFGRSDASLIGAGYVGYFNKDNSHYRNRPYTVTGAALAPWLFRGTGLGNGGTFGNYGIEINQRTSESPPGTQVLARIPNQFGPGQSAEMTYYTTARGAKVFSAGVINFGGSAEQPLVSRLLANLWRHLSRP
jgi:hypothetical protein